MPSGRKKKKARKSYTTMDYLSALGEKMETLEMLVNMGLERNKGLEDSVRLQSVNNQRNVEAMIKAAAEMVAVFNKLANLKTPERKRWWQ